MFLRRCPFFLLVMDKMLFKKKGRKRKKEAELEKNIVLLLLPALSFHMPRYSTRGLFATYTVVGEYFFFPFETQALSGFFFGLEILKTQRGMRKEVKNSESSCTSNVLAPVLMILLLLLSTETIPRIRREKKETYGKRTGNTCAQAVPSIPGTDGKERLFCQTNPAVKSKKSARTRENETQDAHHEQYFTHNRILTVTTEREKLV